MFMAKFSSWCAPNMSNLFHQKDSCSQFFFEVVQGKLDD